MYNNSTISDALSEEIPCEMLQFLQHKIRNKQLSVNDIDALRHIFDGLEVTGTTDDFARFYGQKPVTVRTVICRKYIGKPKRAVLYSFRKFRRLVPASWRCIKEADCQSNTGDD